MASTSVTFRLDANLKKEVEGIFEEMGLNMTTAITMFAKAVARQRKIPFEITAGQPKPETNPADLPGPPHLDISKMSKSQLHALLQEGMDSVKAGRTIPAEEVWEKWERRFAT